MGIGEEPVVAMRSGDGESAMASTDRLRFSCEDGGDGAIVFVWNSTSAPEEATDLDAL